MEFTPRDNDSSFLTEDTGTGDATVPVVLVRIFDFLIAAIIALWVIILAHAALSVIAGRWL